MLKPTPFHSRTAPLVGEQTWRRWTGHQVASAYEPNLEREYAAMRGTAALFDVSPLRRYRVTGRHAAKLLDRMVTRDVMTCGAGQTVCTPWCDGAGKVIADGAISRTDEETYNLTSVEPSARWLAMNAVGLDVAIDDVSERAAALSLQGPSSRAILQRVTLADLALVENLEFVQTLIKDIPVTISRTGCTGGLGYEICADADNALALWDTLVETGDPYGLAPAGIWALDLARIEAGLALSSVDYVSAHRAPTSEQKSTPLELGFGWAVSSNKGPYNGRRAIEREQAAGKRRGLVGIDVSWPSLEAVHAVRGLPPRLPSIAWRGSAPLYRHGHQVGHATSGCWSPLLERYIALAQVGAPHFVEGTTLEIDLASEHVRGRASGVVVRLPFFDPPRRLQ